MSSHDIVRANDETLWKEPETTASRGLLSRAIDRQPLLTAEDELRLAKACESGDSLARETLIRSNLRLLAHTAARFRGHGVPFPDLVQEGAIGLTYAVDRFDWQRGVRLATYAVWWIRHSCKRAIENQGRTIRLPSHVMERRVRLARIMYGLEISLGRAPTYEELAAASGLSVEHVQEALEAVEVRHSLDRPLTEDSPYTYLDALPDDGADLFEETVAGIRREGIRHALSRLSERDRRLLELRFGFDGGGDRSFPEIGREFGISTYMARYAQAAALNRLRLVVAGDPHLSVDPAA